MTKARADGTNYVHSLLTGYGPIPDELKEKFPDFETTPGLYFNQYFPNLNIAMAPPIAIEDQVTYADGTKATVPQMSQDVSAFLTWTAEPKMVERKQTGLAGSWLPALCDDLGLFLQATNLGRGKTGEEGLISFIYRSHDTQAPLHPSDERGVLLWRSL